MKASLPSHCAGLAATAPQAEWQPLAAGQVLFATRIGICAMAWGSCGVVGLQLPVYPEHAKHSDAQATAQRMLAGVLRRRPADYVSHAQWSTLPPWVAAAVQGVQRLLAGHAGYVPQAAAPLAHWGACEQLLPPGVLPDRDRAAAREPLPLLHEIALDWHGISAFHQQVYGLTRAIAPGQTRSYGALASELGQPGLARAIGHAMGVNPFAPVVPCHRVMAAHGQCGGFSGGEGLLTKLHMLQAEGAAWGGTASLFGD